MDDAYVGIDIGGSHIGIAIYDSKGENYGHARMELDGSSVTNEELTKNLVMMIRQLSSMVSKELMVIAMGIGSPGPLNPAEGIIKNPPNLPNIKDFRIVENIKLEFPEILAFLINDADAAVLGEVWLGSARGFKNVVMLTLGTGIGSGIIANGKLQRGRGMGGEWGHTTIFFGGQRRLCSCGRWNCLEAFCGTEGLVATYCRFFSVKREDMTSAEVYAVSKSMRKNRKTDLKWEKVFGVYCRCLTESIINIANIHHPECIVLGGGIADLDIVERVKKNLETPADLYPNPPWTQYKLMSLLDGLEVRLAVVTHSGVVGAAKHAIDCYERRS